MKSVLLAISLIVPMLAAAQNMVVYNGTLTNGWQDYGYTTRNYQNTSPVYAGSYSVSVTIAGAYQGLQIHHADFSSAPYASLSFWLNGGTNGGQHLQIYGVLGGTNQAARYYMSPPAANTWQQYIVPLAAFGVANATNFDAFVIQDSAGSAEPTFYLDDIELVSTAGPAVTHLNVNAAQPIRTADPRWFGLNVAVWDSQLDNAATMLLLTNMGTGALRFPGGSGADDYHWVYDRQDGNNWTWATTLPNFIHVITNLNGQAMTTVNYGSGSTNEAAAWVAYVNAPTTSAQPLGIDAQGTNWRTAGYWASLRAAQPLGTDDGKNFLRIGRAAPLGFKYWEIGNEIYGASWETDSNTVPHDPYTYALRARDYISLMKAVDPTIKIGVVVTTGEDNYVNNTSHPVVNPRTHATHYGWTPVLLATLNSQGVTPDFAIYHQYPQNPGGESDAGLLASTTSWAADAANLRQMLNDYLVTTGTNVELLCTENNSVSSGTGKQTTSLVNGLFRADSLARLMQTEFNGLFWWDLRNGPVTTGVNNSASLYGWRQYGDYGIVDGLTNVYPTYYTAKLMTNFVQAGDTVLTASSDYTLLSTYGVRRQNGSLTLLTINKDPMNTLTGAVAVAGFTPATTGNLCFYGVPQDNAAQTGSGSPDVLSTNLTGVATNFSHAFPPYSATVMTLAPAPATLQVLQLQPTAGKVVLLLQGQAGVPYVIQRSSNLTGWTSVGTYPLTGSSLIVTNTLITSFSKSYWRAVWQP